MSGSTMNDKHKEISEFHRTLAELQKELAKLEKKKEKIDKDEAELSNEYDKFMKAIMGKWLLIYDKCSKNNDTKLYNAYYLHCDSIKHDDNMLTDNSLMFLKGTILVGYKPAIMDNLIDGPILKQNSEVGFQIRSICKESDDEYCLISDEDSYIIPHIKVISGKSLDMLRKAIEKMCKNLA